MSSFHLDEREKTRQFAAYFKDLEDRLAALERASQLSHASIEGGSLDIYDGDGSLKGSIGIQPDGGVALVPDPENTEPPPTPTAPIVAPALAGLLIAWDGAWSDAVEQPSDFALVQVHVGTTQAFTPDVSTQVATITAPLGGSVTVHVEGYEPVWVRLVAQNTAVLTGLPSEAVEGRPRQAVPQDLIDGIVTDVKLAENAVTKAKIALGAVTLNALGGALSDSAAQRYVDAMGDPAAWTVTERSTGATWTHHSGIADAPTGQTVGRATGYTRLLGKTTIPYEPNVLYRLSARIRMTGPAGGTEAIYVGVAGIGADGVTLVNRTGTPGSGNSHAYVAASNRPITPADGWVQVIGFLGGRAAAGASGSAGPNTDPRSPGLVHADVRFITPYVWLNYNSQSGTQTSVMEVDCVTLEALRTGVVDSINITAGAVTAAAIATDAVTAGKILAGAVTTAKLDALAVTAEKIASLAITTAKLDALAVTADKLAVNSVTATKIEAGAINATHIKAGSITVDRLTIGTSPNMLPDPSFEGAGGAALVDGQTHWTIADSGNGSAKSIQANAVNTTAVIRTLPLAAFPILPGQQLRLAVDANPSADWNGVSVRMYARWVDAAGNVTFGFVTNTAPPRGAWTRLEGVVTAPAGAVSAEIRLGTYDATAGTVLYDNAVIQPVISGVQIASGAITAEKLDADAINGKTITGATIRTAESGPRVVMDNSTLTAHGSGAQKIVIQPDYVPPLSGANPSPRLSFTSDDGTNIAYIQATGVGVGANLHTYSGTFTDSADGSTNNRWHTYMGSDQWVAERIRENWAGAHILNGSRLALRKNDILLDTTRAQVSGILQAGNIKAGRTSITPSAANTPTSTTVTGLGLTGSNPRAVATPSTASPGTVVTGVGCTDVSLNSLTIWLTRSGTANTAVDYLVIAS
ncbi:hypothetical protein [Streptomyces hirsutus]|uniref:hypothetical protein n=1 Tax=Streptomyces hirsutus TaxID=35620 RepID=UPI00331A28E8